MKFNDVSGKSGLIQQCEINLFGDNPFTQISGNANRLAIFTNYLCEALSRYATLALMSDYNWEWDDRNQTDLPIGRTAIVSGQKDYSIATEHSIVTGIEIKENGIWRALDELDERFFSDSNVSISQYMSTPGSPIQYTKVANSIFLFPAANWSDNPADNTTWSLRVHFKRAPSYYTSADTTKVQGFTDLHSTYLSDYATWKYAFNHTMSLAPAYERLKNSWEQEVIPDFYSKRSAEHSKLLRPVYRSSR